MIILPDGTIGENHIYDAMYYNVAVWHFMLGGIM